MGGRILPVVRILCAAAAVSPSFDANANFLDIAANLARADSNFSVPGAPAVATDGQNFLVVSCRQAAQGAPSGLTGTRISSSGAVVGEFAIAPHACSSDPQVSVGFDGVNYLVVYVAILGDLQTFVRGVRVTPAGQVLDTGGGFDISTGTGSGHGQTGAAFDGTNYLVVWRRFADSTDGHDVLGARVTRGGISLGEFPIAAGSGEQINPSVAFARSRFLVLWQNSIGSGPNSTTDVFATRISTGGAVLDGAGIPVATQGGPQEAAGLATDGVNFLAVWTESNAGSLPVITRIRARRLAATGRLLDGVASDDGIAVNDSPFSKGTPFVAFDGTDFVIAWRLQDFNNFPPSGIHAVRVSTSGALVGEPASAIGVSLSGTPPDSTRHVHPRLAFNDTAGLAVWVKNIELSGQTKSVQGFVDPRQCFPLWERVSLARGNQWTYRKNGAAQITATVSTQKDDSDVIGKEAVRTLVFGDGFTESMTADCAGIRLHGANDGEGSTLIFSLPATIATPELSGNVVSSGQVFVSGEVNGTLSYSATSQNLGAESVTVPAGRFNALKIRTTFSYSGPGGSISQIQTYWTVPGIGLVKVTDNVDGEVDVYDLASTMIDTDADGVDVRADNCAAVANAGQDDTDNDGIGDACDPDGDGDGLADNLELALGTNPLNADTDNDGLSDGDEVAAGGNPVVNEGAVIQIINSILLGDD